MEFINQEMPKNGDTVVVGLSGGVDSTLTALLLKSKGCKVIGVTMSMWDNSLPEVINEKPINSSCFSPNENKNIEECKKFCLENEIEYYIIDVKNAYRKNVLEYFKTEYRNGRTPNPCIRCNQTVKFGALIDSIEELGIHFDFFCTGHYANIVRPTEGIFGTEERPFMISGATDISKDQTYFLYRLSSKLLEKIRFPLAQMKKSEVFELAQKAGLMAANRKESQDFIANEYFDLLFSDIPSIPGDIIDLDGKVLGKHRGIEHYTVGQRRGLGVAVNYPVYVHSIDVKNNTVILAPNDSLNSSYLIADDFVWPLNIEPNEKFQSMVKIRLASRPINATIEKLEISQNEQNQYKGQPWKITFEQPQRAVAPGQSVVLYKNNVIFGGGIICSAED